MHQETVNFLEWTPQTVTYVDPDVFVFKPRGNRVWVWVLKTIWKFLSDVGAVKPNYFTKTTYTQRVIEPGRFVEQLFAQRSSLMQHFRKDGRRLLIGAEDYRELMRETEASMMHFQFDAGYRYSERGKPQIFGMTVEVVPWMKGCLVMPEEHSATVISGRERYGVMSNGN